VPTEYQVTADTDGVFQVIPDGPLVEGVYEITAQATDTSGAQSAVSEPVRIVVAQPGYITVGQWALSVMSLVVPLTALLLILVLLLLYGVARIRRVGAVVRRETTDALAVLEQQFTTLRETLDADADTLAATRKSNQLTKAEQELVDSLTTRLDDAYAILKREIAEVDDIVE